MSTKTSVVKHAFSGTTIPILFQSIQERVTLRLFTQLALKLNRNMVNSGTKRSSRHITSSKENIPLNRKYVRNCVVNLIRNM